MTDKDKDRIECAIRHINSCLDVDPWARDIAIDAMQRLLEQAGCRQVTGKLDIWDALSKVYNMDGVPDEAKSIIGDVMLGFPFAQIDLQPTCNQLATDTIYRQDAIDAVENCEPGEELFVIKSLPSAEPEKTVYIPETKAIPTERSCVDLDEKVTATYYDEEHEEWTRRTVTIADVLNSVCDYYTILPSAQPEPKWIPCAERLPIVENDIKARVLVTTSWGLVKEAYYRVDYWDIDDIPYKLTAVVAWMPLPESYRGDENDE